MTKAMALLGGTFDPIHQQHIDIAKHAYAKLPVSEVRFIPCKIPALKEAAHATEEQRLAMLEIALKPYSFSRIDTCELDRDRAPSYLIDTLQDLRVQHPKTPFAFILGLDAFSELPRWHRWESLFDYTHFVVINRPGAFLPNNPFFSEKIKLYLTEDPLALTQQTTPAILFQTWNPSPLASRRIREQIAQGDDVSTDLPAGVWVYIQRHHLYRSV